jgi:hypothetical protein
LKNWVCKYQLFFFSLPSGTHPLCLMKYSLRYHRLASCRRYWHCGKRKTNLHFATIKAILPYFIIMQSHVTQIFLVYLLHFCLIFLPKLSWYWSYGCFSGF